MSPQTGMRAKLFNSGSTASNTAPADVLEVDVDALRAGGFQPLGQVGLAVVEAGVEAEFLLDEAALPFAAGDADDATALDLGDLADHRADRPGRRRHDERLAGLRFADVEQAGVGGQARHPEHAQRVGDRAERGVDLLHSLAIGQRVLLPAGSPRERCRRLVIAEDST